MQPAYTLRIRDGQIRRLNGSRKLDQRNANVQVDEFLLNLHSTGMEICSRMSCRLKIEFKGNIRCSIGLDDVHLITSCSKLYVPVRVADGEIIITVLELTNEQ